MSNKMSHSVHGMPRYGSIFDDDVWYRGAKYWETIKHEVNPLF